jgi:CheY-like chemotaxis protein
MRDEAGRLFGGWLPRGSGRRLEKPDVPGARRGCIEAVIMLEVLVVEDDADSREMLCEIIRALGHRAYGAADADEALALASRTPPHIAFVDLGLPGADGCAFARSLRKDSNCASAYLVALTGYGNPEDKTATRDAGFNQHLLKPVGIESVRAALQAATPR